VRRDKEKEATGKKVNNIICRCEEVTEEEIREAIKKFNLKTVDEVKRLTRRKDNL